tara:strand:+ start:33 stop:143 length:111 start_codon:yes stop_codon:yes gene_type:complete
MFPFNTPKVEEITVVDNFLEESEFKVLQGEVINSNS